MAKKDGFFDSIDSDRLYNAEAFSNFVNLITKSDGVVKDLYNMLETTKTASNQLTMKTGALFIRGRHAIIDASIELPVSLEETGTKRIDLLVARLDLTTGVRAIIFYIKEGESTTGTPAAPTLIDTDLIKEIELYQISVDGATMADPVDKRVYISIGGGSGDMTKSIYDPNNIEADAFNMDNMQDGETNKVFTAEDKTKYDNALLDKIPIGTIIDYPGDIAPNGWLIMNPDYSRTAYPELFAVIGTKFGAGDGSTTFGTNTKGRVFVGLDTTQTEFNVIGKIGGHKLLQAHTHTYGGPNWQYATGGTAVGHNFQGGETTNTGSTGGGDSQNLQPYIVTNRIIKAFNVAATASTSTVVDNLTTPSPTDSLSANQGKILKTLYDGEILYNNTTGTNGNVTLSETSANFSYIEIYGYSLFNENVYTKFYVNSGKEIGLYYMGTNGYQLRFNTQHYTLSGVNLTVNSAYHAVIYGTVINEQNTNKEIYITRVVGYK